MKIALIAVIIIFAANSTVCQYMHISPGEKMSYPPVDSSLKKEKLSERNPLLAGTLSLLVPGFGLGQLYNGEKDKFLTHTIISGSCISVFLLTARFAGFPADGKPKGSQANIAGILLFLSAITYAGNYVVSVADAIVSAININKKVQLQKNRTQKSVNYNFGIGLDKENNFRFKTILNF
jgi:TM2 domain-containing membrane protein YozV